MHLLRNLGWVAVPACLLSCCLWPAVYNGGPLLGSDTEAYIRYADVAVAKFTNRPPEWWSQTELTDQSVSTTSARHEEAKAPFLGRSIYYGMLLKIGDAYGMMWPSIALQAAALLLAIALTLLNTIGLSRFNLSVLVVLLAFTTPVAFFASRLMPDMFAGIAILATANLIIYTERMNRVSLFAWVGLLGAALLFHSTHVLVALAIFVWFLFCRVFLRGSASWTGLGAVFFCIVLAFAGDAAFSIATMKVFGVAPIRPPFLTARMVADGPGEAYLRSSCPDSGFAVCRFIDRLPTTADKFLWSSDAANGGVFTPADPATRRALSNEQFRFALAVLRYDPLGEATAMARNTLKQIGMVSMSEFNLTNLDRNEFRQELPPRYLKAAEQTRSWNDTMPVALMSAVVLIVLLAAASYIVRIIFLPSNHAMDDRGLEKLAVIVIGGIILNAFVCGAMSDPYRPVSVARNMVGTFCCSIDVPAIQTVQVRSARFDSVKHFRPGRLLPPRADMESMTRRARLRRYLLKAFQLDEEPWVIFLEVGAYRREIDNAEKRAARTRMRPFHLAPKSSVPEHSAGVVSSTHIGQFTGRPGCPTFWLGRHLEISPCRGVML